MNEFPLIELTEEALKENAISLLGNDYAVEKEKELLNCFFENERFITTWNFSNSAQFAEEILEKFNKILNFHGVESLYDSTIKALEDVAILYCNSGDSYTQTIIWYNSYFYIGDWGSLLEWLESEESYDNSTDDEDYENDEDIEGLDDDDEDIEGLE